MILFLEDWKKYPRAIVDGNTENKSFLHLALVYREMGIRNHTFLLALLNPDLQGKSPRDPNLSLHDMAAMTFESRDNPFYYFREVARVPAQSGSPEGPFLANRANIALFWCFFNHCWFILIQPRQTGKSFSTDNLMVLLLNVICRKTSINLLTKDDILRRANIERIKDIMDAMPRFMNMRTAADANNGEEITIQRLGNKYKTHLPQQSPKRALIVGRGLTTAITHLDEPPFQPNISISLPASLGGTGAAQDAAKAAGAPFGTIMTTTAGKKDDRDGKYIYSLVMEAAEWTELFYDARDVQHFEEMVRTNSRGDEHGNSVFAINGTFNHRQLGYTDAWLYGKIENAKAKGEDAARDFMNTWTAGSQSSPLDPKVAEAISNAKRLHDHIDLSPIESYITRWYIPKDEIATRMRDGKFIMALDTSEASGGDDCALVMIDVEDLKLVAIGNFNETNMFRFSEWICKILVDNPNITTIIERRSTGSMLIDYLCVRLPEYGIDPFKRLFNKVVNDSDEFPDRYREVNMPMSRRPADIYTRYKKTFGFATSASGATSRTELYSATLRSATEQAADRIYDTMLSQQILGLVMRNGRVDHEAGEHDDLVIAWLLAHWFLTLGKNLAFYGIDIRRVRSSLSRPLLETREEMYIRHEQEAVRAELDALYLELGKESDEYVSRRLEQQIRMLDKRLIVGDHDVQSVDELLRNVRDNKRTRRYTSDQRGPSPSYNPEITNQQFRSDRPLSHNETINGYR